MKYPPKKPKTKLNPQTLINGVLQPIRMKFVDFGKPFDDYNNMFLSLLRPYWNIEVVTEQPDYVICGPNGVLRRELEENGWQYRVVGKAYAYEKCIRIFYTGELVHPDFSLYDYAFTFDHIDGDRHLRVPLYYFSQIGTVSDLLTKPPFEEMAAAKTKFCSFLVGNEGPQNRIQFFDALSQYKQIDAGGAVRNNIGRIVSYQEKPEFLKPYKFNLCFENTSSPGYNTEKLFEAMQAHTIPIYWGDPMVHVDFNTKSFVYVSDFPTHAEAIEHIIKMDNDDSLWREMYEQPYFRNNELTKYVDTDAFIAQFRKIFERGPQAFKRTIR